MPNNESTDKWWKKYTSSFFLDVRKLEMKKLQDAPSHFCKGGSWEDENVFVSKKHFLHHIFQLFQFSKFSDFLPKKPPKWGAKEIFTKKYHFIRNLQQIYTFIDLEKNSGFSSKNTPISAKVINFWTFLEFLLFQSNLTAKLLQIGRKKISRSVAWTKLPICRERSWKTSGRKKRH